MKASEIRFLRLWRKFYQGGNQLWTPTAWVLSAGVGIAFHFASLDVDSRTLLLTVAGGGLTVSGALLGVVLTTFALVIAFTDIRFLAFADEHGELYNLLFPFWFAATAWITAIVISGLGYVIGLRESSIMLLPWHCVCSDTYRVITVLLIFAYMLALSFSWSLVGLLLKFVRLRLKYEKVLQGPQGPQDTSSRSEH